MPGTDHRDAKGCTGSRIMVEREDVERYEKLLSDWRPAPARRPAGQEMPVRDDLYRPNEEPPAPVAGKTAGYGPGAILSLQGQTLVVYKQAVPEKGFHLVLALLPGGKIKLQGVALESYTVEEIGTIAAPQFEQMQRSMSWSRDLLVFHCYSFEDVARVPQSPEAPQAIQEPTAPAQPAPQAPNGRVTPPAAEAQPAKLRRGQRLQIRFGQKSWDAVYWGQDSQGHVVAHMTFNKWALMHLELDRFGSNVTIDPSVDEDLVRQIEAQLNGAQ